MLAGNQAAFTIDGVAVVMAARFFKFRDMPARLVPSQDAVVGNVRPQQIPAGREIGRPLGPPASRGENIKIGVDLNEALEILVEHEIVLIGQILPSPGVVRAACRRLGENRRLAAVRV